ncbi:MAG TPA: glycosyltransferase, partial [Anaerolineaceae bacterium]|nr:glycosyltransferase [Anaerolineaceae bacterium]
MKKPESPPRLALVGPMLGRRRGWVTNPGERLAGRFRSEGYVVRLTSTYPNRALRLADMLLSMAAWRNQVDVFILAVYSGRAFWLADLPARLAHRLGIPLIYVLHGGDLPRFSQESPDWVRRVMGRADAIVSPSAFLAHHFQQWGGYDVRVIPNLLEVEQYAHRLRPSVRPRLLWMRTFEDIYNPEMAVQALKAMRATHPEACLTMAGQDRGQLAVVQALARAEGLEEQVRFAGFLDPADKQVVFDAHDIYLHTNRVDNAPVS